MSQCSSAWHTFRLGKVFRTFLAPCQLWNSSHKKSRRNEIRQFLIGILATRSTLWFLKFSLSSTRQIQLYNNENVVKVFPLWSVYSHINLSSNVMRITKGQSNSHLTVWGCSHREKLYLDIQRIRFFSLSQPLAKDSTGRCVSPSGIVVGVIKLTWKSRWLQTSDPETKRNNNTSWRVRGLVKKSVVSFFSISQLLFSFGHKSDIAPRSESFDFSNISELPKFVIAWPSLINFKWHSGTLWGWRSASLFPISSRIGF